jgi:predicted cation transporter
MLLVTGLAWMGLLGVQGHGTAHGAPEAPGWSAVALRAFKAYLFVLGLVLLGRGFSPLAERWLPSMPGWALYWLNSSSAVLDNATLVAAEVGPQVPSPKLLWLLMGLLISGGMLVPGNIPNILCAGQRRITAREWARVGVPVGLGLMALTHLALLVWG